MSKFQKFMELLRRGDFRGIWEKGTAHISQRAYTVFAVLRDKRFAGIAANKKIPSRYKEQGAYSTQSSDYRCLKQVFSSVPLNSDDVFIDVGCGEGRVLTYLYSRGFRGKAVGIELDEDIAAIAAKRTATCGNVTICCGNVLEQQELFKDATVVYLFNPFSRSVMTQFIGMLESVCERPVRLVYLNCLYVSELDDDERWTCLKKGVILRPGCRPMDYSIHELTAG